MIPQIDAKKASELMQDGHTYVDVRTVDEFKAGHAQGAVNVPAFFREPSGSMMPNPDFLRVMEANFTHDAGLVVGCHAGGRSQKACEFLVQAGFSKLHNIQGGFGGAKDPLGRVLKPGWSQLGLPVSQSQGEGESYESMRARAGSDV
jgi:rhodanese-related sulfurtransferase